MITLNNRPINITTFPDKTTQVWKLENIQENSINNIEWFYENPAEILDIIQLIHYLENKKLKRKLTIPYLPYARQDHLVDNQSTFAGRAIWHLLQHLDVDIEAFDMHSSHHWDYINNIRPLPLIKSVLQDRHIIYPDAGAHRRYSSDYLGHNYSTAEKIRDQSTGQITSYKIDVSKILERRTPSIYNDALVIDDICDGGATFEILGKVLKEAKITASLYVSHGIFSKGIDNLLEYYDVIYTTDSLKYFETRKNLKLDRLIVLPYTS